MAGSHPTLIDGFLRSCEVFPDRPAMVVEGKSWSYTKLRDDAAALAATLQRHSCGDDPPITAIFAHRSAPVFAGVLAALMRGHGYVPLTPAFPPDRTLAMFERTGANCLIVDAAAEKQIEQVLHGIDRSLILIFPERDACDDLKARLPKHRLLCRPDLAKSTDWKRPDIDPSGIAYLLFTSGSTGVPKGVMVSHRNIRHLIDVSIERYQITEHDRFSQMSEMLFDHSVFDMFVAWERGACMCCPSQREKLTPAAYINDQKLTIFFGVPSTGVLMKQLGLLAPGAYPTLRVSLFAGEALPADLVDAWSQAAPNSIIDNLYGPTEVTIDCTWYRWDSARSSEHCLFGTVPIGYAYPDHQVLIVDSALNEVAPGQDGELFVSGPQVSLGYWRDPATTARAFVKLPGRSETFYRTGDLVRRPLGDGPIHFLGRIDHQVKVRGHRVELGEIEAALRQAAKIEVAVALGWPITAAGADGIVAFVEAPRIDARAVQAAIRTRLPNYMVPRQIRAMERLPLNINGKVDRKALIASLDAELSSTATPVAAAQ